MPYKIFLCILCIGLLNACGSGLCPVRTRSGACLPNGGGSSSSWVALQGVADTSFGTNGYITQDYYGWAQGAYEMQADSSGRIVVVGQIEPNVSDLDYAVMRFTSSGQVDTSFGTAGVILEAAAGTNTSATSVKVQPDGKIMTCGATTGGDSFYARYNSDGSPDTSFGTGGNTSINFAGTFDACRKIYLLSGGKYLSVGTAIVGNVNFALMRLLSDGSLDTSFGTAGKTNTDFAGSGDISWQAAFTSSGKIVVGGTNSAADSTYAIARYTSDGALDTSFGVGGIVTTNPHVAASDDVHDLIIDSNQKILAAGTSTVAGGWDFQVIRYLADGAVDTSFGTAGVAVVNCSGAANFDYLAGIKEQPDGKYLVGGWSQPAAVDEFSIARLNSNGSLDSSFANSGCMVSSYGAAANPFVSTMLQLPSGAVLLGSYASPPSLVIGKFK